MRQSVTAVVLLLTVLQLIAAQGDECYQNEVYSTNSNPCDTCDVRGYCPGEEPGCDCVEGYFKDRQGICVQEAECYVHPRSYTKPAPPTRPRCAPNEVYSHCGPSCPATCHNPDPNCNSKCVSGCHCRRGFVRSDDYRCIPRQNCPRADLDSPPQLNPQPEVNPQPELNPQQELNPPPELSSPPQPDARPPRCGSNEIFSNCGSACPETCDPRRTTACPSQCVRGCFCRPGYVRKDGRCVPRSECAPVCPAPLPPVCVVPAGGCPSRDSCNRSCRVRGYFEGGRCVGGRQGACMCSRRRRPPPLE